MSDANIDSCLPEIKDTAEYLRKESVDLFNRLHSIAEDITFVDAVRKAYPNLPIIPNLRCGAWYTDPVVTLDVPAYFKSTDGHTSNWSFNLRRANLHLLPHIVERNGLILVDSTRSGKRMPDALSKTVPIWCAVINRAMVHPHLGIPAEEKLDSAARKAEWDTALYTPPGSVSAQEHDQIASRLDGWAEALVNSSFALPRLPHPLRPLWITPSMPLLPSVTAMSERYIPIVCVSASKQSFERSHGFSYVQGSGDDHEKWGLGLSPDLFWANKSIILAADRERLPELVADIVARNLLSARCHVGDQNGFTSSGRSSPTPIHKVEGRVMICTLAEVPPHILRSTGACTKGSEDAEIAYVILCPEGKDVQNLARTHTASSVLRIPIPEGKRLLAQFLTSVLPTAMPFVATQLNAQRRVCIACPTGKDISVSVAVVALQRFYDENGALVLDNVPGNTVSKKSIRTRLEWVIASRPVANPSRALLKRVNEYLMSPRAFWLAQS